MKLTSSWQYVPVGTAQNATFGNLVEEDPPPPQIYITSTGIHTFQWIFQQPGVIPAVVHALCAHATNRVNAHALFSLFSKYAF